MTARKVRETDIAAAPPPPAEADGFMHVVLTDIAESPFNPRRSFDTDALAELASSIREVGVLQPLVVRRVGDSAGYDLVCGARRLRAARLAGLERVPCIVRELSDIEAAHARLIENCQRQDVSPIEEAVAFRRLEELGEDAEEIGGRIGRPKRYVRDRLALLLLPERLQQLVDIGLVHLGAGVFVARLEADVRAVVLERVLEEFEGEGGELLVDVEAMTLSEARRIASAHQRQFRSAPWSLDDASLAPVGAGACAVCPCNTATQPDLFGVPPDGGTGSCARPTCWDERTASYWERVQADHKAKGGTVGSAPRQRLHGVQRRSDDGVYEYVLVDTLAAKAGVAGVLVQNPYGVGFTTCYSAPDVAAGLEAAGEANLAELVREQYARAGSYSDSQKAAEAARKAEAKTRDLAIAEVVERVVQDEISHEQLYPALLRCLIAGVGELTKEAIIKSRKLSVEKADAGGSKWGVRDDALRTYVAGLELDDARGLIAELCARIALDRSWSGGDRAWAALQRVAGLEVEGADGEPGIEVDDVRSCDVCGCTDDDCSECIEATGVACHWVEESLCSRCAAPDADEASE